MALLSRGKSRKGRSPKFPEGWAGEGDGKGWGRGAAQGLEEGGGQLPTESPTQTHREPGPHRSHTHPRSSHAHTLSQACTHAHRLTHVTPTLAYTRMHTHTLTHTHAYRLAHTHTPGESEHSGEPPAPSIHPSVPGVGRRGSWAPTRALRRGPQIRGLCEGPRGAGTLTLRAQPRAPLCPVCVWTPGLDDVQACPAHTQGLAGPRRGWTLTDEGHSLGVDDAAGQQVEVVLLAVHHHGVASIVAPLGTETGSASTPGGLPGTWLAGVAQRQALRSPAPAPGCPGGRSVRRHPCWDVGSLAPWLPPMRVWGSRAWPGHWVQEAGWPPHPGPPWADAPGRPAQCSP